MWRVGVSARWCRRKGSLWRNSVEISKGRSRGTRRSINILEVLRVSDEYPNLSRSEKLEIVNERLSKPISMGSFKRYYAIVKDMNADDIMKLTKECEEERGRRLKSMNDAIESGKDNKTISKLKRKVDYLS